MEKKFYSKNNKRNKRILLLIILGLGIGFAIVTKYFNIDMNTLVKTQSWNVYFEDVQVRDGSIDAPLPVIDNDKTSVDYSANLEFPEDFYEFTVVAVNDGTLDAMIDLINFPEIDSSLSDKVSYTVTYMDGVVPQRGDILVAGHSVTYKVRVEYADTYSESLEIIPFASSFSIDYVLANNQGHNVHINHELNSIGIVKHTSIGDYPVYMDNMQESVGSVDASIVDIENSKVNYKVVLEEPGDFYEFTVDAVNAGGKDVIIRKLLQTELDAETLEYLQFVVTYENGDEVQPGDRLQANSRVTYKVLVKYIEGADSNKSFNFNLNFSIVYAFEPNKFIDYVEDEILRDNNINFMQISSNSNGKGLYVRSGTENDTYPIYYYRGDVNNNNARFGGVCWKIVRTTDTGGVKLVYNGTEVDEYENYEKLVQSKYKNVNNDATYPFSYDSTSNEWTSTNHTYSTKSTITFTLEEAGDYIINYKVSSDDIGDYGIVYRDGVEIAKYTGVYTRKLYLSDVTTSTVIRVDYVKDNGPSLNDDNVKISIEKGSGDYHTICSTDQMTYSEYNSSYFSPGNAGYMYGTVISVRGSSIDNSHVYGSSYTYSNGTYTLTNTKTSGPDSTHHYSCLSTSNSCSTLNYIYYVKDSHINYVRLENGQSLNDVFEAQNTNTNDSIVKAVIDNWFANIFQSSFTSVGKNYNDYLEDTVWCNDRSFVDDDSDYAFSKRGWNPNGGGLVDVNNSGYGYGTIYFGFYNRLKNGTPSLTCPQKNDAFTVNDTVKGNGALTYPVGLLTGDEIMLAGAQKGFNQSYYLYYGNTGWWTMTPEYYSYYYLYHFFGSNLSYGNFTTDFIAVRPSISVKKGVKIRAGGDGTEDNPYEFIVG